MVGNVSDEFHMPVKWCHNLGSSYITVGHKDGIFFSPQLHGIFLAVGDI